MYNLGNVGVDLIEEKGIKNNVNLYYDVKMQDSESSNLNMDTIRKVVNCGAIPIINFIC